MNEKEIDVKIGEAWKAHHKGEQQKAITQFKELVAQAPDNVDALWGLGLSYRKAGDLESALDAFERARSLVKAQLDENPAEYGRLFMLNRMLSQQIDYMANFIK